jgi:hypothetical protein
MRLMKLPLDQLEVFAISPDANKVTAADKNGVSRILDATNGKELIASQGTQEPVNLDRSPSGDSLAVLNYRTMLQIWEVSSLLSGIK